LIYCTSMLRTITKTDDFSNKTKAYLKLLSSEFLPYPYTSVCNFSEFRYASKLLFISAPLLHCRRIPFRFSVHSSGSHKQTASDRYLRYRYLVQHLQPSPINRRAANRLFDPSILARYVLTIVIPHSIDYCQCARA
jgi:hypothetical protein